jgi:DNA-binding Lrp family transcriptional regulator
VTKQLNDNQLAEIAWASDAETTRDLADRLGVTYAAVRFSRKRLRAEGFTCRLYWTNCRGCGEPLAGRRHTQEFHEHCGVQYKAVRVEQYRSREDVRSARAAYLAANADRARVYQERQVVKHALMQLRTKPKAIRHRQPWNSDEDAMVLQADRPDKLEAVAIALGRSFKSVLSRRSTLRSRSMSGGGKTERTSLIRYEDVETGKE